MKLSRLILNGINGRYPREICDNALPDCELVEAAVAYASDERLLFEWCLEHDIPLKFWGRFGARKYAHSEAIPRSTFTQFYV